MADGRQESGGWAKRRTWYFLPTGISLESTIISSQRDTFHTLPQRAYVHKLGIPWLQYSTKDQRQKRHKNQLGKCRIHREKARTIQYSCSATQRTRLGLPVACLSACPPVCLPAYLARPPVAHNRLQVTIDRPWRQHGLRRLLSAGAGGQRAMTTMRIR